MYDSPPHPERRLQKGSVRTACLCRLPAFQPHAHRGNARFRQACPLLSVQSSAQSLRLAPVSNLRGFGKQPRHGGRGGAGLVEGGRSLHSPPAWPHSQKRPSRGMRSQTRGGQKCGASPRGCFPRNWGTAAEQGTFCKREPSHSAVQDMSPLSSIGFSGSYSQERIEASVGPVGLPALAYLRGVVDHRDLVADGEGPANPQDEKHLKQLLTVDLQREQGSLKGGGAERAPPSRRPGGGGQWRVSTPCGCQERPLATA